MQNITLTRRIKTGTNRDTLRSFIPQSSQKAWLQCKSKCKMADEMLRVVEFYSGIGGMHFALKGKRT